MAGGVQGYETQHLLCIADSTPRKAYLRPECKTVLHTKENEQTPGLFPNRILLQLCTVQFCEENLQSLNLELLNPEPVNGYLFLYKLKLDFHGTMAIV